MLADPSLVSEVEPSRWLVRSHRWLGETFAGLTWPRLGIFFLIIVVVSLSETPAVLSLVADNGWGDKVAGVLKSYAGPSRNSRKRSTRTCSGRFTGRPSSTFMRWPV